jgi:hypothetical protein
MTTLRKNGKDCLLCLSRGRLILVTPEEKVRQKFIQILIQTFQVPADMIKVEMPILSDSGKVKFRADIVVSGIKKENRTTTPVLIVECKEPDTQLTDPVRDQALSYAKVLKPKVAVITNGNQTKAYQWNENENAYEEIKQIPLYQDLLTQEYFPPKDSISMFRRPNHLNLNDKILQSMKSEGFFGQDTEERFFSFITNLIGLFLDPIAVVKTLKPLTGQFNKDCSVQFTTFGNASGGSWVGNYRSLLITDSSGDNQIIRFSILGKMKAENHPLYGNSKGHSMLLVAVDDYDKSHLSLQLALDRFVQVDEDQYTIWHDGTLTAGKKGMAKKADVLNFIQLQQPSLVRDGKILLGQLNNSKLFTWDRKDVIQFVSNVIDYALLRDQFRRTM